MEHVFEILIGLGRALIAIIGFGGAVAAFGLAAFGLTYDYRSRSVDKETAEGVALLLVIAFCLSAVTSVVLRVTS